MTGRRALQLTTLALVVATAAVSMLDLWSGGPHRTLYLVLGLMAVARLGWTGFRSALR